MSTWPMFRTGGWQLAANRAAPAAIAAVTVALAGCASAPTEGTGPAAAAPAVTDTAVADTVVADTTMTDPAVIDPAAMSAVTDVYWKLTEVEGEPAATGEVDPERAAHIRLSADSRVTGSTGCNVISGPFTVTGDAIDFGAVVTTRMACVDPELAAQEERFVRALEGADRFVVASGVLTLYTGDRAVARFAAGPGGQPD